MAVPRNVPMVHSAELREPDSLCAHRMGTGIPDLPRLVSGTTHQSQGTALEAKPSLAIPDASPDVKPPDATSPRQRPCWHCGKFLAVYRGKGHYCSAECRFWDKVDRNDTSACWLWTAYRDASGYGRFFDGDADGDIVVAHRYAYQVLLGPIPDCMELHHLCGNRACVNPAHLELSSHRVNIRRGNSPAAANAKKTHCPAGHPYDNANTYIQATGGRKCLACNSEAVKRDYQRHAIRKREQSKKIYRIRRALLGKIVGCMNADKINCKNGHSLSGDNLYEHPDGKRVCRTCALERRRDQRKRQYMISTKE